jgi:hypothetical protein
MKRLIRRLPNLVLALIVATCFIAAGFIIIVKTQTNSYEPETSNVQAPEDKVEDIGTQNTPDDTAGPTQNHQESEPNIGSQNNNSTGNSNSSNVSNNQTPALTWQQTAAHARQLLLAEFSQPLNKLDAVPISIHTSGSNGWFTRSQPVGAISIREDRANDIILWIHEYSHALRFQTDPNYGNGAFWDGDAFVSGYHDEEGLAALMVGYVAKNQLGYSGSVLDLACRFHREAYCISAKYYINNIGITKERLLTR